MLEIKIKTHENPGDPLLPCYPISKHDIFIDGLKQLCSATGMTEILKYKLGDIEVPVALKFEEGSSIGLTALFNELGFHLETGK